jgi:hypothetical protein
MARVHVIHTWMYMYNVGMCNKYIKILCRLYFEHIKIYQSYLEGTCVYFGYIQVVFQIYTKHIRAMLYVYPRFIIPIGIINIITLKFYYYIK